MDSAIWSSWDVLRACWIQVNIPDAPDMVGTVLHRVSRSLFQRRRKHLRALGGMLPIRAMNLLLWSSGSVRTCWTVSIDKPRMTFCVLQVDSPLHIFFSNIGSLCEVFSSVLGQKSSSMARNRCHIICRLSTNLPCTMMMKSSG